MNQRTGRRSDCFDEKAVHGNSGFQIKTTLPFVEVYLELSRVRQEANRRDPGRLLCRGIRKVDKRETEQLQKVVRIV